MKTITKAKFDAMLLRHHKWLHNDGNGKRMVLNGFDLRGMDLRHDDLRMVRFINCDLSYANFRGAKVQGLDLLNSKLAGVNWNGSKGTIQK